MIGFRAWVLRALASGVFGGGTASRLPILMYHRVMERPDPMMPDMPDVTFVDDQFEIMRRVFTVLPLEEAVELLAAGRLPPRAACITFDDGYRDNYDVALPLLKRHGLSATFFVASGFVDGGRMFNDTVIEAVRRLPSAVLDLTGWGIGQFALSDHASRARAADRIVAGIKYFKPELRDRFCDELAAKVGEPLPDDLMMSSEQVRDMAAKGMSIGGHTVTHPILTEIELPAARDELLRDREALTAMVGKAPMCFAYPNGKPGSDYVRDHVDLVMQCGYRSAVCTAWGMPSQSTDRYQLPRFGPFDRVPEMLVARTMRMAMRPTVKLV